jgi:hypothetical protein
MQNQGEGTTRLLNVDLNICSMSDLEPLVTALGDQVYVLPAEQSREAHLELKRSFANADAAIREFTILIEALPKEQRELWDTAESREFSIGVQAEVERCYFEISLSTEAVEAAARLRAQIGLTVYPPKVTNKPEIRSSAARDR